MSSRQERTWTSVCRALLVLLPARPPCTTFPSAQATVKGENLASVCKALSALLPAKPFRMTPPHRRVTMSPNLLSVCRPRRNERRCVRFATPRDVLPTITRHFITRDGAFVRFCPSSATIPAGFPGRAHFAHHHHQPRGGAAGVCGAGHRVAVRAPRHMPRGGALSLQQPGNGA